MLEKNDSGKFSKLENSVLGKGGNFYCCNQVIKVVVSLELVYELQITFLIV